MNYFRGERARFGGGSTPQPSCSISSPHHLFSWSRQEATVFNYLFFLGRCMESRLLLFILQELGRWCGWREPPRWQNVGGCVFVSRRLVNLLWRILKGDHMVQERNTLTFSSIPPLSRGYSHASPTTSAFSKGLWLWRLRGGAHSLGFFGPEALTGEVVSEHPTCTKLQLKSSFLLLQWNNDQFMDNDLTFNLQLQVTLLS